MWETIIEMSSFHLKRAVEAWEKAMGKAGEVASDSICQPSHPAAPIAAARGLHSNVEPLLGAQSATPAHSGAWDGKTSLNSPWPGKKQSPNPRFYGDTKSRKRAPALRRFLTSWGETQKPTRR